MRRRLAWVLLAVLLPRAAPAQEWRAGAQVGRVTYPGAGETLNGSTLALGLSRLGVTQWLALSAGIPLETQPWWGAAGLWQRWGTPGTFGIGADLSAHAFLQHDPEATSSSPLPLDPTGAGATDRSARGAGGELVGRAFGDLGSAELELRAGAAAEASRVSGERASRLLPLAEARVRVPVGVSGIGAEVKRWWGSDASHTYAGANAQWLAGPVILAGSIGQWLAGGTDGTPWSAGAALSLGAGAQLEGSYRAAAFDPLYATETGTSFSLGLSLRLGGSTSRRAPVPAQYRDGRALLRLPADAARGTPRIAGDFNDWQPQPMVRAGNAWTYTIPLKPGVYHYAFVNERDEWFVPAGTPGRQSDGMGGWQAVLVVE